MKLRSVTAAYFSPTGNARRIVTAVAETVSGKTGVCIKCQACVKICPVQAKYFDDPVMLSHIRMLEEHYARQIENEVFL